MFVFAFSRNERTHPNFVSQAQEIEIFCEDCQLAAPVSFFRGFQPRFRVHLLRHVCSPLWFFGRTKTNYIILNFVYTRRFVRDRSFLGVLILDRARPLWPGCEITCFCYIAGTDDRIYSVHEHDFASRWLWDLNRGSLIIIASRTEFSRSLFTINHG